MAQDKTQKQDFDLEERTARFGEAVIRFVRKIPKDTINVTLISQLTRAATSIGANYCEADDGVSRKDFRNKIGLCRKESRETKHWLRMIAYANPDNLKESRTLWREAQELTLIFSSILKRKTIT